METVFLVCAAIGGTIMVLQFLLSLVGLGGHIFDVDMPHDIGHDFGGDLHGDVGGDFHGDSGDATAHADQADSDQHGTVRIFSILSLRTVVAALAFFGLGGLAARSSHATPEASLLAAIVAGGAAMAVVYWMMRTLRDLRTEGTVRIHHALGQHGNVYLRIPAKRTGSGKIQFNLQNRTMEYLAVTAGPELPTGSKVVVVGVVNPTTLEVQAET